MNITTSNTTGGYIALMTVIIVATVISAISVSMLAKGTSSSQESLSALQSQQSLAYASGCIEAVLLDLKTGSTTANQYFPSADLYPLTGVDINALVTQPVLLENPNGDDCTYALDLTNFSQLNTLATGSITATGFSGPVSSQIVATFSGNLESTEPMIISNLSITTWHEKPYLSLSVSDSNDVFAVWEEDSGDVRCDDLSTVCAKTYTIANNGDSTLTYDVTADKSWVVLGGDPSTGTLGGGQTATIQVSISTDTLPDTLATSPTYPTTPIATATIQFGFVSYQNGAGATTRTVNFMVPSGVTVGKAGATIEGLVAIR